MNRCNLNEPTHNVVGVKARVDSDGGIVNIIEYITSRIGRIRVVEEQWRLIARRRERKVLVEKIGISAILMNLGEVFHVRVIEIKDRLIGLEEGIHRDLFLLGVEFTDTGVVNERA